MHIHQALQQDRHPNCTQLAAELEVVPRTIKRDVDFMKCRLKLAIAFAHHAQQQSAIASQRPCSLANARSSFRKYAVAKGGFNANAFFSSRARF